MIVPEAAMQILKDHPEGMTAKQVTDEIISRKLYTFSAKEPVQIVARAMNRHCLGIDRSYACQERFFSVSKDNTGTLVFKLLPGVSPKENSIIRNFTFPKQQVQIINNGTGQNPGAKTRIMDAENQSIRDLLGKHCFYVPDYQRSYSWKAENMPRSLRCCVRQRPRKHPPHSN